MIFIIPVGFDYKRILDGLKQMREKHGKEMKKIYFLQHYKGGEEPIYEYISEKNLKELKTHFQELLYDIKVIHYDPGDYRNVFKTILKILKEEATKNQEVWIDVTSTSRVALCFITSIAYIFPNTHVYITPYKTPREYPDPRTPEGEEYFETERLREGGTVIEIFLSQEEEEIGIPSKEELKILSVLKKNDYKTNQTKLIEKCEEDPKDKTTQNRYTKFIKRLEKQGYIKTSKEGREKIIKLTEWGSLLIEVYLPPQITTQRASEVPPNGMCIDVFYLKRMNF